MSDSRAPDEAVDKGRRLSSMISMGFGYFQAKRSLEAHDWNVDDAAASILADKSKDRAVDSVTKAKSMDFKRAETAPSTSRGEIIGFKRDETASSVVALKGGEPQFSPDSDCKPSSSKNRQERPTAKVHDVMASRPLNDCHAESGFAPAYEGFGDKVGGSSFSLEDVEEPVRGERRSVPGAFREGQGDDGDTTTAWDSMGQPENNRQGPDLQEPYMAVAEVVRVPELIRATQVEPTESINAAAQEDGDLEAANDEPAVKSTVQETRWSATSRRTLYLLLFGALVAIGLVAGLVVTQTRRSTSSEVGVVEGRDDASTRSPMTSPTPVPGIAGSGNATTSTPTPTLAVTTQPLTTTPTSSPTRQATASPTAQTTVSPIGSPSTSPTTASPTSFPTTTPTDEPSSFPPSPTVQTTPPSTKPPTETPTQSPAEPIVGELLGDFTDARDTDSYPDFTRLIVSASATQVELHLKFHYISPSDLRVTIYMDGDNGNQDYFTIQDADVVDGTVKIEGTVAGSYVEYSFPRIGDDLDGSDVATTTISFPGSSMPDLMNKQIWVYSERSKDRMPDDGATPSYFTLSP